MVRRTLEQYDYSKLEFDETLLTKHFTRRTSRDIKAFGVHHMIILNRDITSPDALETLWNVWQDRAASAHYGVDGPYIRQYVYDKDYAWAQGHTWANNHLISVEHANQTLNEAGTQNDYLIDEATWRNGARLIANGHKLYKLGSPRAGVTVRKHSDFFATACPGPYLGGVIWHAYNEEVGRVYDAIMSGKDHVVHVPPPAVANASGVYKVRSGDTLSKIALAHGTTWKKLQELNGLPNPNLIRVGQELVVTGSARKPMSKVVDEVLQGKWGNDPHRAQKLRSAGYDPIAVQNEVNRRLRR